MLTMLIVDDEFLVRTGIRNTIEWANYGIEIIGDASDGVQGLELAIKHRPDIILTDIRMPVMDGLEFMDRIRGNNLDSIIIILSGFEEFDYVRKALHNGAFAYLLKPIDNQQLTDTVQRAAAKIKEERSVKQYFNRLESELSSIKKQFLRDLVTGVIKDRDEISDKIKFFNMPIDIDDNLIVVVRIDEYPFVCRQLSTEALQGFKALIMQGIANLLLIHSAFIGVVVDKPDDEWIILLHSRTNSEDAITVVKERCNEIIKKVREKYTQSLSIGISDICKDIENLNNAYKDACFASLQKLLPGVSSMAHIRGLDTTNYRREVRETIKYIQDNYSKDITVEMAAREQFISSSYLMHLFKDSIGKTFIECLTDYRIEVAKQLLKDPKYKIYEVSESVGYDDVKYFSQIFKKTTGITPSEYVKVKT